MADCGIDVAERLRERLKLKYVGNCKCGHCQLVPDTLITEAADAHEALVSILNNLITATDALLLGQSIHNSRKPDQRIDGPVWDAASGAVHAARTALESVRETA
jgi:hypothetical protein